MQASAFRMYKHCNLCAAKKRKPREQKQPESEKRCPCAACVAGGGVVPLVKLDLPEDPSPFDPEQDRVDEMWETSGRARR